MNEKIRSQITIAAKQLSGNIGLAPMAGNSSVTFRMLCSEFGCAFGTTELVSARGIAYQNSVLKSYRYLEIDPEHEAPCAIQLFGYDAADFSRAIPLVLEHPILSGASFIDLNMGCPVPKVVKTGAGSALMRDLPRAAEIITASVKAASSYRIPVTVKFRKGWDAGHVNAVEFARLCADCGASAVTVHARTKDQMYHGKADWDVLRQVADALRGTGVTVIGNGDVNDGLSARKMFDETGVNGIAVGRAAQGDPWIFARIQAFLCGKTLPPAPTPEERAEVVNRHLRGLTERLGEKTAVKEMRTQLAFYFKGQKNAVDFKSAAMRAETFAEVMDTMYQWVEAATQDNYRGTT